MATVFTALPLVRDYVPYERPPQDQTLWTAIPRGLQTGVVNAGVLDAKPVNDDQILTCTMTLPPNFGYVMAECNLSVHQNRALDWNVFTTVELTNFLRGSLGNVNGFKMLYLQELNNSAVFGASKSMNVINPWPSMPIVAPSAATPTIVVIEASNTNNTVSTAGTVDAFVSFWQFDLEQIRKYPINSPQPVHSR